MRYLPCDDVGQCVGVDGAHVAMLGGDRVADGGEELGEPVSPSQAGGWAARARRSRRTIVVAIAL